MGGHNFFALTVYYVNVWALCHFSFPYWHRCQYRFRRLAGVVRLGFGRVSRGIALLRHAPLVGARLVARISGPGRRCTEVCADLATGSPLSRGVSWCRSAHPRHCYLHNGCCIGGGDFVAPNLPWGTNLRKCFLPPRPVGLYMYIYVYSKQCEICCSLFI